MRLVSLVSAISRSCRVRSSSPLTTVERALSIAWIWRSVLSPIWSAKAPRRSSISDRNWFACSSMPEVMAVRVSRRTLPSAATRSERSAAIEVAVWSKPPLSDEIRSSSADSMRSRTSSVIEERICVRSSRADCIASVRLSRPDRNAPRVVSKARSLADSRSANWVPNVPVCSEKRERKRPDSSSRPERKRMPSLWIDWLRRLVRSANKVAIASIRWSSPPVRPSRLLSTRVSIARPRSSRSAANWSCLSSMPRAMMPSAAPRRISIRFTVSSSVAFIWPVWVSRPDRSVCEESARLASISSLRSARSFSIAPERPSRTARTASVPRSMVASSSDWRSARSSSSRAAAVTSAEAMSWVRSRSASMREPVSESSRCRPASIDVANSSRRCSRTPEIAPSLSSRRLRISAARASKFA